MKAAGCIVTTAESAVYEASALRQRAQLTRVAVFIVRQLMKDAKHPKFKDILAHVKELAAARSKL